MPLGSVATFRDVSGPTRVTRYNLYPAVEVLGDMTPGTSFGQGMSAMEALASRALPEGFSYEWTELAYQQQQAGNTAAYVFVFAVVVVFLVLAGQYESLTLPLAVVLIVPMCLLAAITGVLLRGQDNNILTQIGLVVLVGLACKNAILIVEFAKQAEDQLGLDRFAAAAHAARLRLRPILMTSFAFILGVVPLVIASWRRFGSAPGAGHRRVRGDAWRHVLRSDLHAGVLRHLPPYRARSPAIDRPPGHERSRGSDATNHRRRQAGSCIRDAPVASIHRPRAGGGLCLQCHGNGHPANRANRGACLRGRIGRLARANAATRRRVVDNVPRRSHDIARRAGARSKPRRPPSHGAGEAGSGQAARARGGELAVGRSDGRIRAPPVSSRRRPGGRTRTCSTPASTQVGKWTSSAPVVHRLRRPAPTSRVSGRFAGSPWCQWRRKSSLLTPMSGARRRVSPSPATTSPTRQSAAELTQQLLTAGRGTQLDVDRAIALLESTRASIPPLVAAESSAIYRLGVLVGSEPQALAADLRRADTLPPPPDALAIGEPISLLRRRPDVAAAELAVLAAAARAGVAAAELFPRLVLTGGVGLQSFSVGDVDNRGLRFGFGVGVTLPFFEWNRIRQRILAADATAEIALADYERTALTALEEAERAITAYVQERERFRHLDLAARSARAAADLARQRFQFGADNFLTVLDAERVRLDAEDRLAQSRVEVTRQAASIFKALGGGWSEAERLTSAQLADDDRARLRRIVEVGRRNR